MTLRAAVIGCGRIGSAFADDPLLKDDVYSHADAYRRCAATDLVAVCDADAKTAARCAERWGLPRGFTDVTELLSETTPEIVSICTPDDMHFAIAREALEAPSVRAILCEKPIATSEEEGEALVRLARERGKLIAVGYSRRYASNFIALRDLLASGDLGAIRAANGWYGKGTLHNGSHLIDLLRMLAGEIEWIEAWDRLVEPVEDPSLDIVAGLESGAVATLRATDSRAFTIFELDLLTERGRVSIRNSGHVIDLFRAAPSPRYSGYTELVPEPCDFGDMRNTTLHAVEDLAEALGSGRPPLCSGEDGLAALRIVMAARKSAANGGRIRVSA